MEWVVNNWGFLLIILAAVVGVIDLVRNDKEKAKKWLLLAVTEAEKQYGSKTGILKLRSVYEQFLHAFPLLSKFLTFEAFSEMVDDALTEMQHYIDTNMAIFEYVGGYQEIKKNADS